MTARQTYTTAVLDAVSRPFEAGDARRPDAFVLVPMGGGEWAVGVVSALTDDRRHLRVRVNGVAGGALVLSPADVRVLTEVR